MPRLIKLLLIATFSFFLAACEEQQPSTDKTEEPEAGNMAVGTGVSEANQAGKNITIALVMKTLTNPFFVSMEKGARRAERELGITLIVKTAAQETSANQQISIIEKLARDREVDAIIIAPADSVRLIPSLKKARDQGIRIVNLDNRLDPRFADEAGLGPVPFISIDNRLSAYLSASHIARGVTSPAKAVILEGIREARNAQDRLNGARDAFNENANIKIVASRTARWKIDEAFKITGELFAEHPDITLLFSANDMMALGAIEFLRQTGRKNVRVAAFDAIDDARTEIRNGWMAVTVDQQPAEQGYMGVKTALDIILGKPVEPVILLDGLIVTR